MEERRNEIGAREEVTPLDDMDKGTRIGFIEEDGEPAPTDPLELHKWLHAHDRAHVDLLQDEYTPEEAARLLGTSLEVIMHAARNGDLKAERQGKKIMCIQHADLVDWLNRRLAE
ncbi:MAG: helix-turn-helix domain-containing protein [Chloroflexota bacterium]